jgi:hypothetical protein
MSRRDPFLLLVSLCLLHFCPLILILIQSLERGSLPPATLSRFSERGGEIGGDEGS